MTALYQLSAEYRQAADKLAELDIDEQTVSDTLEGLAGDLEAKAVATAMVTRNLDALAESIKQAEAGMVARRKAIEARADRIREYLLENMLACGMTKIESPYFELSVRENPSSVIIDCAADVPPDYWRHPETPPPVVDKKLVAQAIKDGFTVSGAHLERIKRLVIK